MSEGAIARQTDRQTQTNRNKSTTTKRREERGASAMRRYQNKPMPPLTWGLLVLCLCFRFCSFALPLLASRLLTC